MEQLYYNNKDIQEIYQISRATACKKMKEIREIYKIDEKRLPKKGLLPVDVVKKYFKSAVGKG